MCVCACVCVCVRESTMSRTMCNQSRVENRSSMTVSSSEPPPGKGLLLLLLSEQTSALCCRWEEELAKREQLDATVDSMQQVHTDTSVWTGHSC